MFKGNSIITNISKYAFAAVDQLFSDLKEKGITPIDFGVGDPKEPTPVFIRDAAKKAIDERASDGYPPYIGTVEFRKAVSAWSKKRFNIDLNFQTEICSCVGSKEMVFNLPNAFLEPDDYVIMPNPGYPPYSKGTLFARGIPYYLNLTAENGYIPDFNLIPEDVLKKAKILWINYPNSPTGTNISIDVLKSFVDFAKKHNLILINDECYSEIYFGDENKPSSILEITKKGVLAINSMSKRSCMTGWRIGWIAGDPELISIVKALKTNVDSGTPFFIQDAAVAALSDEKHVAASRKEYTEKRDIILNAFKAAGVKPANPKGTFYIWQKLPDHIDEQDFAKKLLEPENAIVVTPGSWIGETTKDGNPGKGHVRFALVPTIEECHKAAEIITRVLKSF